MMSTKRARIAAITLWAAAASSQTVLAEPPAKEPALEAYVHSRIGRVVAPFFLDAVPVAESEFTQAISFVVGGHFRVSQALALGMRIPAAPSLVAEPAGSYVNARAFGNPELFAEKELVPREHSDWTITPRLRAAIGLPLAGHGPTNTLHRNRVIAVSAAMEAWREQELYVPGVLPLTAAFALEARGGQLSAGAAIEMPLLFRINDASTRELGDTRAFSFVPNASVLGGVHLGDYVVLRLAAHVAAQASTPVAQPGGNVQFSIEPAIEFRIGAPVSIGVDSLVAIGGPLSGTLGFGLRAAVHL